MAAPITNLLFDLDGTLTDSRVGIIRSIQFAMRGLGAEAPADDALQSCIGPPIREILANLLGTTDRATIARAFDFYIERYESVGYRESAVFDGVVAMLTAVSPGRRLFVATSKLVDSAERVLTAFKLRDFFEGVFGADRAGRLADKRELIPHLVRMRHLARASTAMVGDRVQDIAGARASGIVAIGAQWGYGTREELARADYVCARPANLASILAG